jgi:hypothetical protein
MGGGFLVDLEALNQAADGVNGTVETFSRQQVSDIPYETAAVGHQELADSISSFLSGWQRGVQNLVSDATTIARSLVGSAAAYDRADTGVGNDAIKVVEASDGDRRVR